MGVYRDDEGRAPSERYIPACNQWIAEYRERRQRQLRFLNRDGRLRRELVYTWCTGLTFLGAAGVSVGVFMFMASLLQTSLRTSSMIVLCAGAGLLIAVMAIALVTRYICVPWTEKRAWQNEMPPEYRRAYELIKSGFTGD